MAYYKLAIAHLVTNTHHLGRAGKSVPRLVQYVRVLETTRLGTAGLAVKWHLSS